MYVWNVKIGQTTSTLHVAKLTLTLEIERLKGLDEQYMFNTK